MPSISFWIAISRPNWIPGTRIVRMKWAGVLAYSRAFGIALTYSSAVTICVFSSLLSFKLWAIVIGVLGFDVSLRNIAIASVGFGVWNFVNRQPRREQGDEPIKRKWGRQQLEHFHRHSLTADIHYLRCVGGERLERLG